MKKLAALFVALALLASAKEFDVRQFGAAGDGKTMNTVAIQKALDACQPTGGTVKFPAGTYPSQPNAVVSGWEAGPR